MQDLEELKKEIERGGVLHGHLAIELIDRLQAAEKDQKVDVVQLMVDYESAVEDWAAAGITLTPLYADPVAQSRDSAEPIDQGGIFVADSAHFVDELAKALGVENIMPHDDMLDIVRGLSKSNANDHIADAGKMVPTGLQLVPIEPTSAMLDAAVAMALQVTIHGQGGWSKYIAALYAQLLSAAPQANADHPDYKAQRDELLELLAQVDATPIDSWYLSGLHTLVFQAVSKYRTQSPQVSAEQPEGAAPEPTNSERSSVISEMCDGTSTAFLIGVNAALNHKNITLRQWFESGQSPAPKAQGELLRAIKLVLSLPKQSGRIFKSPTTEERLFEADAYRALHAAIAIAEGGK